MATVFLFPRTQFFDNSGNPLNGGLIYTYIGSTTTPQATFTDSTGTVQNANPVVCDSAGRCQMWLSAASYKFIVKTSAGVTTETIDNYNPATVNTTVTSLIDTGNLTMQQSTAATSGANQTSNTFEIDANIWNGSASAADKWQFQDVVGTGTNPTSTLTIGQSGSTGAAKVRINTAVDSSIGFRQNGTATSGHVLRGDGTNFVDAALASTDLSDTSSLVTLTGTQTLTNKTLTAPVISTISNTGTLTLPTSTDTLVGKATTDTLTNKTLTSPVINGSPTGTGIPTVTLKKGSGAGNYSSASTTYVQVDGTNLTYTVTIPTGWKLLIQASFGIFVNTASVAVNAAIADGGTVVVETSMKNGQVTGVDPASISWVITGDGASHTIDLRYKTSNASDSVGISNSSSTDVPTMTFLLTPSN